MAPGSTGNFFLKGANQKSATVVQCEIPIEYVPHRGRFLKDVLIFDTDKGRTEAQILLFKVRWHEQY